MLFGMELRLPADLVFGLPPNSTLPAGRQPPSHVIQLENTLREIHAQARIKDSAVHQHQREVYDLRQRGPKFAVGDVVWLLSTAVPANESRKLHWPWSGPYRVLECLSSVTYRIQLLADEQNCKTVHFDRLKHC